MTSFIHEGQQGNTELPKLIVSMCYGCKHLNASALSCTHPDSYRVLWDVLKGYSYRLPSTELCNTMYGYCTYFYPDKYRSIQYAYIKKAEEKEKKGE